MDLTRKQFLTALVAGAPIAAGLSAPVLMNQRRWRGEPARAVDVNAGGVGPRCEPPGGATSRQWDHRIAAFGRAPDCVCAGSVTGPSAMPPNALP